MRIELDFNEEDIDCLWSMACANFYKQQRDRFSLYEKCLDILESINNGTMLFCNDMVKAKIIESFYNKKGIKSVIIFDEYLDTDDYYVVVIDKPFRI